MNQTNYFGNVYSADNFMQKFNLFSRNLEIAIRICFSDVSTSSTFQGHFLFRLMLRHIWLVTGV